MQIPIAKIESFLDPKGEQLTVTCAWLDVANARLIACDGHRAVRVPVGLHELDISGLVPVEAFELARKELKAVIKANGKECIPDPWVRVVCHPEAIEIENLLSNTRHLVNRPKLPDDKPYPNVDAVFPLRSGHPSVTINRAMLAQIASAMDGGSVGISLWLDAKESNQKCVLIADDSGTAAAVLMPMSCDANGAEISKRGAAAAKL